MAQQSSAGVVLFVAALFRGTVSDTGCQPESGGAWLLTAGAVWRPGGFEILSGRPVLLVVWMTSCGVCRRELPVLRQVAPEFRNKGIAVVAVRLGGVDDACDYMRSNHVGVTSLIDSEGAVGRAYKRT